MDRICIAVLDKICSLAGAGRYVVFSEDELMDSFPDGEERCEKVLKAALKFLQSDGYVDVKYSSGNMYCVAPLKNYEPLPEPEPEPGFTPPAIAEEKPKLRDMRGAIFISAFFGGALGSLIVSLIFALIKC